MWTYHANDQSPAAVATVFAASQFDPPREAVEVFGHYDGDGWHGTFRVRDGLRRYRLSGRRGRWTIEVDDDAKGGGLSIGDDRGQRSRARRGEHR